MVERNNVIRRTLSIARMKEMLDDGKTLTEIAAEFKLPERLVAEHLEEARNYKSQ